MFRLLKLALLGWVGYKAYEYFQSSDFARSGGPMQGGQRYGGRPHPQNMTGPGEGRRVDVDTAEGTPSHSAVVGRGAMLR